MENVWAMLANAVYGNGQQYHDIDTLEISIRQSWQNIDLNALRELADSMKNRIFNVILAQGKHSGY